MKIEKLRVGMIVKNYKLLCEILDIEISAGNTKKAQLKELERFIKYHKEGNKFIIDEVYAEPKQKIDKRKEAIQYNNFLINKKDWNKTGVYTIILNKDIYIGSTIRGFRQRFLEHLKEYNNLPTKDMLKNNGIFKVLWIANNSESEKFIRDMENYYIKYYRNETGYNVINNNDAWSYTEPKEKPIRKNIIKIDDKDYKKTVKLLSNNDIKIYDYYNNEIEVI